MYIFDKQIILITLSVFIAMLLSVMPMPTWTVWLRPDWLMLVFVYWLLVAPERVGLFSVWFCGLLFDVLQGTVLGEHALAMTVSAFLTTQFYRQTCSLPYWQQALIVLVIMLVYRFILLVVQGMLGEIVPLQWFFLPALGSMLLWPCVYIVLRDLHRYMQVEASVKDSV